MGLQSKRAGMTDVPIPERCVVKFKPGKEMRAEVIKIAPKATAANAEGLIALHLGGIDSGGWNGLFFLTD